VLGLLSVAVYLPSLPNEFVNWDDPVYVSRNPHLDSLDGPFVEWAFTTNACSNWHPLTWISLGIDTAVWGKRPSGYRLTSLLLHGLNTVLTVLLFGRLARLAGGSAGRASLFAATTAGAVFGLHPLHVESVAWIAERKDVLYAFFWLLAFLAWIRYATGEGRRARPWYFGLSLLLFALSLLAKPMAVTLPLVLIIADSYPLRRIGDGRAFVRIAILEKLPFFVLAAASSVVTLVVQRAGGAMEAMAHIPLGSRLWGAEQALGFYLWQLVAPVSLVPFYPLPATLAPLTFEYLAPLVLVLAITAAALLGWRRTPVVTAAWAYYVVTLVPVLGIVQVGSQAAADRYMYLPMLGPLAVLAAGAAWVWRRGAPARGVALVALVLVSGSLAALTVRQIGVWRNSVTLWTHVTRHFPDCASAFYQLGHAYRRKRDFASAENAWRRTVEIAPRHSEALNGLGNLAMMRGSLPAARDWYRAAVIADDGNAEAHFNLALALEGLGDHAGARRHYRAFVDRATPEYAHLLPGVRAKLARPLPK
jgi:hypothetical protein